MKKINEGPTKEQRDEKARREQQEIKNHKVSALTVSSWSRCLYCLQDIRVIKLSWKQWILGVSVNSGQLHFHCVVRGGNETS